MYLNKTLITLGAAAALATGVVADSNLDWYGPRQSHTQVCGQPGDHRAMDCDDFMDIVVDDLYNKAIDSCKESSCSGSFEHYGFQIGISAVFPPSAKDEFSTQLKNIIGKMFVHENQKGLGGGSIETKMELPSKMILNRYGDGNEKGHMTITAVVEDDNPMCEIFKILGIAGGFIPEAGPFFGLVNIADC